MVESIYGGIGDAIGDTANGDAEMGRVVFGVEGLAWEVEEDILRRSGRYGDRKGLNEGAEGEEADGRRHCDEYAL